MLRALDANSLERLVRDYLAPGIRTILREEMERANVDKKATKRNEDQISMVAANLGRLDGRVASLEDMIKNKAGAEIVKMLLGEDKDAGRK